MQGTAANMQSAHSVNSQSQYVKGLPEVILSWLVALLSQGSQPDMEQLYARYETA